MLEAYLSREDMIPFYDCSDFPFNFGFVGFKDGVNAEDVKNSIEELLQTLPEGKTANWVVRKNTIEWKTNCFTNYDNYLTGNIVRKQYFIASK